MAWFITAGYMSYEDRKRYKDKQDYAHFKKLDGDIRRTRLVDPSRDEGKRIVESSPSAGRRISITDLFTAGIIPGLILVGFIVGGVRLGIFTASGSSRTAVAYALGVTRLAYRSLDWPGFVAATLGAVRTTAMVLLVIGCAAAFGWLLASTGFPEFIQGVWDNPVAILLLFNLCLLLLGTFVDMSPLIVITTPIFLPVAQAFGVDPHDLAVLCGRCRDADAGDQHPAAVAVASLVVSLKDEDAQSVSADERR